MLKTVGDVRATCVVGAVAMPKPTESDSFSVCSSSDMVGDNQPLLSFHTCLPKLFFGTVNSLLSENGTLWLCHVPRENVTHDVVRATAQECGFEIRTMGSSDIRVENCPLHDRERAIVYHVRRR